MQKDLRVGILLDFYGELLSEKHRDVINYYYNHDLSLSEIADTLGISRQGVRDAIKKAESILYNLESRLKIMERHACVKEKIYKIVNISKQMKEYSYDCNKINDILDCVDKIISITDSFDTLI